MHLTFMQVYVQVSTYACGMYQLDTFPFMVVQTMVLFVMGLKVAW